MDLDRTPPPVPGFVLGDLLGRGSGGEVWRAAPAAGGAPVAVKVVRAGPGADRELAALRAVVHPHVVRLRQHVVLDDGRLALVLDLVEGTTLAAVVAQRGHLTAGEVVTVVAPLAGALADLHAMGVQHGDLAPGNVLLDRSGRPVLADLGTPRVTGEPRDEVFGTAGYVDPVVLAGGRASPASDVYGLGALAWLALAGAPPEAAPLREPLATLVPGAPVELVAAIEAAVAPDPARRPGPAVLATSLLEACEPAPVWGVGAGPHAGGLTHRIRALAAAGPQQPTGRRHRAGRDGRLRFAVAGALATTLVLALTAWWLPTGARPGAARRPAVAPSASAAPTATAPRSPVADLVQAAAGLTARRAGLLADPSRSPQDVTARGSPAASDVAAAQRSLRDQAVVYRGLRLLPRQVRVLSATPQRAVVELVTATTAYAVVDARGAVVARVAADGGHLARLVLVSTPDGWRVWQVLAAVPP